MTKQDKNKALYDAQQKFFAGKISARELGEMTRKIMIAYTGK